MTRLLAKLIQETECLCKGQFGDEVIEKVLSNCKSCKGTGRVLYRLAFTHADSYEEALHKLLKYRNVYKQYKFEDKFWLVWEKKSETNPIDVTPAVNHRLHDWEAKEIYKRKPVYCISPFFVGKSNRPN